MICPMCGIANPPHNRFCRSCGAALGGGPSGESERRVATVLFADMSGFTAMSERLDPEEVHEIINDFLQELAGCVHRYGGTVNKYIGDEIMAVFGAPRTHEDDPERSLATALEMREGLRAVNLRRAGRLPKPCELHVGLNTGLVIAGRVGDANRSDYDVLGDAVNLAARLAGVAEPGQTIVSESTYKLTRHAFGFRALDPVRVKGKAEPVLIYELLGRRARRESRRGVPGLRARLVGREKELAALDEAAARARRGASGGFVTITGPAGAGKSRLLAEARTAAEAQGVTWVEAACTSLGLGGALSVWVELVRRLLGTDARTAQNTRRTVTTRLSGMTSMISVAEARDASAFLAHLLRLDLSADERQRLGGLDDGTMRRQLFVAVRELIEASAARAPLVLVLDDLHWADSASLKLLEFVLESTSHLPLLVVTAFRNEAEVRVPIEEALAHASPPFRTNIELQPLTPSESGALAEALIGPDPGLAEVRRLLVNYAEGNPFFLEEVLRSLIDQGVLRHEDDAWHLSQEQDAVVLPDSLQGLLLDRIDRLPETNKRLIQIAAVIGRTFPTVLLGEISGVGAGTPPLVTGLEQAGFLERVSGPGGADFRFRNGLMQEAAYSSLLHRHRRDYHRRVAEWYERRMTGPHAAPEIAAILAHHFERAEAWAEAGAWALRAADEARRALALEEARLLYRRARGFGERAEDVDMRRAAEQGLGEIAFIAGRPSALRHFSTAAELAREPLHRAEIDRRIGQALERDGQYNAALAAFTRAALSLGDEHTDEPSAWKAERARLRVARAATHLQRGDDELAQEAAESALKADLPAADRADAIMLLGDVLLRRGDAEGAANRYDEALAQARESGNLPCAAEALEKLAAAEVSRRHHDLAGGHLNEGLALRRRLGDHAGTGGVLISLAAIDEHVGALAKAAERLREAVDQAKMADEPVVAARAQLHLGRVLRILGDWPGARMMLERAGSDDPETAGRAALEMALLAVERGETPERDLQAALEGGQRHGIADLTALARLGLATISRRRGDRDAARGHLREMLIAAHGREDEATTMARIGLAELALDEGQGEMAVTSARMAHAAAERTGPAVLVWRAQRKLGSALGRTGRYAEAEAQLGAATEAARGAGALPELARCLADHAAVRTLAGGAPDAEAEAMLAEMRDLLAYLTGAGPRPAGSSPRMVAAAPSSPPA